MTEHVCDRRWTVTAEDEPLLIGLQRQPIDLGAPQYEVGAQLCRYLLRGIFFEGTQDLGQRETLAPGPPDGAAVIR